MSLVYNVWCTGIFMGVLLIFFWLYQRVSRLYNFWGQRGVPGPRPKFPFGTEFGATLGKSTVDLLEWLYRDQGGDKYCGYIDMHQPKFFTGDPMLIKEIMVKSFDHFHDRPRVLNSKNTRRMLTELRGAEWKSVRSLVSQAFTERQLNLMHDLMVTNGERLRDFVREMCGEQEVDVMEPFALFMVENTASCIFGADCNVFGQYPHSEIVRSANNVFSIELKDILLFFLRKVLPEAMTKILIRPKKDAVFRQLVQEVIQQRREGGVVRDDLPQRMLEVKDKCGSNIFDDETIIQQCVLFLLAGYKNAQSLLSFSAYCLATNPHCQELVLQELDAIVGRHHGQLPPAVLAEMVYLDRFLCEVARLYPPAVEMHRLVTKDFEIPGSSQTVPRGTLAQIPILPLHRDPQHFQDPLIFDPDRFLPERKSEFDQFAYIPFGGGPRVCIGKRFALREIKVALAVMLREFVFSPGPSTPSPPAPVDARLLSMLHPSGDKMMLKISPRSE